MERVLDPIETLLFFAKNERDGNFKLLIFSPREESGNRIFATGRSHAWFGSRLAKRRKSEVYGHGREVKGGFASRFERHTFYRNRRGARYTPSTRPAVNRRSPGKLHELNHLSADIVSAAISILPTKGGTLRVYIYKFLTNLYLLTFGVSSAIFPSSFVQIYSLKVFFSKNPSSIRTFGNALDRVLIRVFMFGRRIRINSSFYQQRYRDAVN